MSILNGLNNWWNKLAEWFGSIRDPNDEINDILADFTSINNRLSKVAEKHEKLDKEALAEIDAVKAEANAKIAELDKQHAALIAAQERAATVSKRLSEFIA